MASEIDEGNGLVKVQWIDIRARVAKVEPKFAKIVDELNPDKSFPIYLAYFPYGTIEGDNITTYIPKPGSGVYSLIDKNLPKDISKNLGYGKYDSPLGMVLDKQIEYFVDLKDEQITIPWVIYKPGSIFSFSRNIIPRNNNRIITTNTLLWSTAGARSTFMLPHIGCVKNHNNLQKDFNIQSTAPKTLYEHWHVFREIANSKNAKNDWRCCVIYFSEKWIQKLHNDKAWSKLKIYLHELSWRYYEFQRNRVYYDISFSIIQNKRNLKPNPYLADTVRHLFAIALGEAPGYIPADTNDFLPLDILQKAYIESYGLTKFIPTIMNPAIYNFESDKLPIYYSMQHPSTYIFSPKSRKLSSTIVEIREIEHLIRIFSNEFKKDDQACSDTLIHQISKEVKFRYFHNVHDSHHITKSSDEIPSYDSRFNYINPTCKIRNTNFASDAPFLRGCISISTI